MLHKRALGKTGIAISPLVWGTVKIGRNQGVKYPDPFSIPPISEVADLLAFIKDLGINALDTAPAYGESEARLGRLLKNQRHEWVLISKAGEQFNGAESEYAFDPASIEASVEASLRRLNTDYLDVLLIHSDGRDEEIITQDHVFETARRLKEQGKIRSFGMSTKTVAGGLKTIEQADIAMVTHNLNYQKELAVIDAAQKAHKGILIKKAFGSGHLVHDKKEKDIITESFKTIFAHPGVTAVVIGSISIHHIQENVTKLARLLDGV